MNIANLMRKLITTKLSDNNASKVVNMYKLLVEQELVSTFPNNEVAFVSIYA